MSTNSYSYMIFGYELDKNWLRDEEKRAKYESMIGGNPKEPVWFFEDDMSCYVGIPLAISNEYGINKSSYDITGPEPITSDWTFKLENALKQKGIQIILADPKLLTFTLTN